MPLPNGSGWLLLEPSRSPLPGPGINTDFHVGDQWIIIPGVRATAIQDRDGGGVNGDVGDDL